jgi:hypothetical protein
MWHWHRVGIGMPTALNAPKASFGALPVALFVPSSRPVLTCAPDACGEHVHLAAGWALTALGHGCRGGHVVLLSEPSAAAWTECLVTVMAVDDAAAGGHRPDSVPGAGLLDRILHDPRQAAELVAAVHL